jgi:hypothetical protein
VASNRTEPLLVSSTHFWPTFALNLFLTVVFASLSFYSLSTGYINLYQIAVASLGGTWTYWYWRRPLRRAAFYEDHFEVQGWRVDFKAKYGEIRTLSRVGNARGSRKNSVILTVQGWNQEFKIPYKRGIPGIPDLYSWLLEKTRGGKDLSLREFVEAKDPPNDERRTLVLGYYLQKFGSMQDFILKDIEYAFSQSGRNPPRDLQGKIQWNMKMEFIVEGDSVREGMKTYFLTLHGMEAVDRLPQY